jgi:hypothetical protein
VRSYLADRYDLPTAGLTPELIENRLAADGLDPKPVLSFLDRCDARRFAPMETGSEEDLVAEAETRIEILEGRK